MPRSIPKSQGRIKNVFKLRWMWILVAFLIFPSLNFHSTNVKPGDWDPHRRVIIPKQFKNLEAENSKETNPLKSPTITFSSPPFQTGWPVTVGGRIDSNPAVGDLNNDGHSEVVFGSLDRNVVVFHHDGSLVNGWPQPGAFTASASLNDIDKNGTLENFLGSDRMRGFFYDGNIIPGWPPSTEGLGFLGAASTDDVNNNGNSEVIAGTITGFMHAWGKEGESLPGWPRSLVTPISRIISGPAVGDLTGGGNLEIVVGSQDSHLYIWDQNGEPIPGFPKFMGARINGEVALGDLDGDDELEIAFGTDVDINDGIPKVHVLNPDGSEVPGWPQEVIAQINGGVAVGDLNDDGNLEVAAATIEVYLWNGEDGTLLPGWPQIPESTSIQTTPLLGDLNGDRRPDILVVGHASNRRDTLVWAWNVDGSLLEGFPFRVTGFPNFFSSPTIADLDGDGDVEIGFGTEDPFSGFRPAKMFFFDLPAPYDPSAMEWPTLSHDFQRTGRYSPPPKKRIPLTVVLPQKFLSLDHPQEVIVTELSFQGNPTGPFAIIAVDGVEIDPIEAIAGVAQPGRLGWRLARFDGRDLAETILEIRTASSEVEITIKAPIDNRTELAGKATLTIRSNGTNFQPVTASF